MHALLGELLIGGISNTGCFSTGVTSDVIAAGW